MKLLVYHSGFVFLAQVLEEKKHAIEFLSSEAVQQHAICDHVDSTYDIQACVANDIDSIPLEGINFEQTSFYCSSTYAT